MAKLEKAEVFCSGVTGMTWLKAFHGLNIIFLALWGLPLGTTYPIYWLLWLAYFVLFDGLLFGNIWCARLLLFPPVLLACTTGPIIGYNFYAFVIRHPLYVDSPATILIVIIFAGVLTVPSLCILVCYWLLRREIFMKTPQQSQRLILPDD